MVFVRGFCNYLDGKSDGRTLWVSSSVGRIIWDDNVSLTIITSLPWGPGALPWAYCIGLLDLMKNHMLVRDAAFLIVQHVR